MRAVCLPTKARSQHMNRKIALHRLCEAIAAQNLEGEASVKACNRLEHTRIEQGNPVRVSEGMVFKIMAKQADYRSDIKEAHQTV